MTTQKIQLAIKAAPEEVWRALTSAEVSPAYYYGFEAHYDLTEGAAYSYVVEGQPVIEGRVDEIIENRKLRMTFVGRWTPDVARLPVSTVTYELGETAMAVPGLTALTLTHEGLPDTETARDVEKGWVLILSGLKTLLETGHPLVPAPAA
ncbi:SRPBCC domain-containing protein [Microbacterium sp. P01]|uniref:SRPBCC domain-containing protein n=1 Tax=unclassified Microbacterium TaxID=2609290 RepID=UPI003671730F